jgi:hypothetical protein
MTVSYTAVGNAASAPEGMTVVRLDFCVYCVVVRRERGQLGPRFCGQPIPVWMTSAVRTVVSRSSLRPKVGEAIVGLDTAGVSASLAHMPVIVVYQMGVKVSATGPYVASWTMTVAPAAAPSAMEYF